MTPSRSTRNRWDFRKPVKGKLAERVAFMCSNPLCRRLTVKRATSDDGAVKLGRASHILPASPGGPRAQPDQTEQETKSFENGIWLCDSCADEIDRNRAKYPADLLREWKAGAEAYVEELVTQDTRLRQLRVMMSPLLATLRILNALPGPGPSFDETFADASRIPVTRLLIEAEQALFENGFHREADQLQAIQAQLERVYNAIRSSAPSEHLDISSWKDRTIRTLMIDIMRFSEASYQRYFDRESGMVREKREELRLRGRTVVTFSVGVVEQEGAANRSQPIL